MQINHLSTSITQFAQGEALSSNIEKSLDGISTKQQIQDKARQFEEIFIADTLKNAKIGISESSLISDTKVTDTFSTFMNKALAETIVSQGGFGLTEQITQSLLYQNNHTKP